MLQMSSRLCWGEVRACRPARSSSNQSQTTDGCYGSDIVCDRECSHHGYVYTATVSDKNGTLYTVDFTVVHRAAYLPFSCAVAGGGRTGGDARITTSHRNMEYPAILLRVVLYFLCHAFSQNNHRTCPFCYTGQYWQNQDGALIQKCNH